MTNQPNRHLLVYTIVNHSTGRSYDIQDDPCDAITGSRDDAQGKLAARIAALSSRTRSLDGFNHEITVSNFRVHSWFAGEPAAWSEAPMGGAENYQAWIDGPGSEAR